MRGWWVVALACLFALPCYAATVSLDDTWRYRVGDDPAWAAADLDDTDWATVVMPEGGKAGAHTGGIVWYRKRVAVATELERPALALGAGVATSYEVFVDGQRVGAHGRLGAEAPGQPRVFELPSEALADGEIVIAVRHWQLDYVQRFGPGSRWLTGPFAVGDEETLRARVELALTRQLRAVLVNVAAGLLLIVVGAFHALIWLRRRELTAYLWYALVSLTVGLSTILYIRGEPIWPHYELATDAVVGPFLGFASLVASVEFVITFFRYPRPRRLLGVVWALMALHTTLMAVPATRPLASALPLPVMELSLVVVTLLVGWRVVRGDRSARVVALGMMALIVVFSAVMIGQRAGVFGVYWSVTSLGVRPELLARFVFMGTMAYALADRFTTTLDRLDASYAAAKRFVPTDFLQLLGRAEVTDVERGDATERVMTVMFADVRGFSTRSEKFPPEENFAWLNRYLEVVEPPIRAQGGFVNQYYGDGILALFGDADQAVAAALAMLEAVEGASDELGYEGPLRIGIGLHTGPLMLGTIGGQERLDTGVVGDAVNTAARIESLTKSYGRALLVSQATRERVDDAELAWEEVDRVAPKGKTETITLFAPTRSGPHTP